LIAVGQAPVLFEYAFLGGSSSVHLRNFII
jgi:hypothetical protein